jgi:hypothetical protein
MMNDYPTCPRCGYEDYFVPAVEEPDGGTGCLIFLFGGFIPYLFYSGTRTNRVQCGSCGYIFKRQMTRSSAMLVLVLTLLTLAFIGIVSFISI